MCLVQGHSNSKELGLNLLAFHFPNQQCPLFLLVSLITASCAMKSPKSSLKTQAEAAPDQLPGLYLTVRGIPQLPALPCKRGSFSHRLKGSKVDRSFSSCSNEQKREGMSQKILWPVHEGRQNHQRT